MPIPNFQEFMRPTLEILSDQSEKTTQEIFDAIDRKFEFTDLDKKEVTSTGGLVIPDRLSWARTYMKKARLIESPKRSVFTITDEGIAFLKKHDSIDAKTLEIIDCFRDWRQGSNKKDGKDTKNIEILEDDTPDQRIEKAYQELSDIIEDELLQKTKNVSPFFFEKLVIDVLIAMGYGGSRQEAGKAFQKGSDEGLDGVIYEDKLGLDLIYVQAKRWENPVGRPEIQKFVGALHGKKARKGIFITTSDYSREARDYVKKIDGCKVVLIDGSKLAQHMQTYGVGVSTSATYTIRKIDLDYFEEAI